MKTKIFFSFTFLFLFFISCKKTSVNEGSGANQGGDASFTLSGAPDNCDGVYVLGTYINNVQTDIRNSVILTVNVTKTGKWTLNTGTLNGLQFSGAGNFTIKGRQTISLAAAGKPTTAGTYNFRPGNMPCSFQLDVKPDNSNLNTAKFSFKGATDSCATPDIHGTYALGQRMDSNINYVVLLADVTTPGTYSISTNFANGIVFSAQGNFTAAGPGQPVIFKATGQTILPGKANFKTGDKPTDCVFTITITSPLTSITGTIKANIDGLPFQFNGQLSMIRSVQSGITQVFFFGTQTAPVVSNNIFYLGFRNNTGPVLPGIYNGLSMNPAPDIFSEVTYVSGANSYNNTRTNLPAQGVLGVTLTTFTAIAATGNFSGKLYRFRGPGVDSVMVTNGTFDLHF